MKCRSKLFAINNCIIFLFIATCCAWSQQAVVSNLTNANADANNVELARFEQESSSAHIKPTRMDSQTGIAVIFEGTDDLHYYAKSESAPAEGYNLTIKIESNDFAFDKPVFPTWEFFTDPLGDKVEVYVGNFTVFVPIINTDYPQDIISKVNVTISGLACTSQLCLPPFEKTLSTEINWANREIWANINIEEAEDIDSEQKTTAVPDKSMLFALALAFIAGLALNIMPCVWPVLPIIVMRIVKQSKESRGVSIALGLMFSIGILMFFAILAGVNIALQLIYGTVLQWGDQFRNPIFVSVMALLLVLLSLFMFGVFSFTVPSAISSKQSSGKGYFSAIGMGLLAAVLSTPCSFGILAAAFAWAQSQPLFKSTVAIMFIGLGMAVPYIILTSVPGLLNSLPRPGRWMEMFKQGIGFILLIIAVKLIIALPEARTTGVLYFAVVLSFSAWMWGTWITYNTKPAKKWLIRFMAIALAVISGWTFLPISVGVINWQSYDTSEVQTAIDDQRPVLIKFTADWCFSCQVAEKTVYSRKDIADLIESKGVLAIKADTTEKSFPATIALQEIYNEPGVPVSMLFIPGTEEPIRWRGILFADELKENLEEL